MGYLTKKFISQFIMPVPFVVILYLAGALLERFTRFKRSGRGLKGVALVCFLLFSYGIGTENYLYQLERKYPSVELGAEGFEALRGAAIVVLGQGLSAKADVALRYQANSTFHLRLQEGMRLYRKIPEACLLVSLAGDADSKTKERFVSEYALEHGLRREGIHLITSARDTADEARAALGLSKAKRLVVVTSASHLQRAVKIFAEELRKRHRSYDIACSGAAPQGIGQSQADCLMTPAPCDYSCVVPPSYKLRLWPLPLPSLAGLIVTHHAAYEWFGNLYQELTD